jgi:flavin reductase (DIM6/NTAB) family NADH-FMN oxidoreductase RutF
MIIDFTQLSSSEIYHTMTQTIIPRPIAWVISDHGNGQLNLAPFSYFSAVSSNPPILSLSVGLKRDGSKKDTWRNIEERSHFVVQIPKVEDVDSVLRSAEPLEHGESEIELCHLELVDFEGSPLPRLKRAPIAFCCEKHSIIPIGNGPQGLILGEIRSMHLDDQAAILTTDSPIPQVSAEAINPLARLGSTGGFAKVETIKS